MFAAARTEGYITALPCLRVGNFDTFDKYFLPGGGDFDNLFRKCQNFDPLPEPIPLPPPLVLDTDRCIKKES